MPNLESDLVINLQPINLILRFVGAGQQYFAQAKLLSGVNSIVNFRRASRGDKSPKAKQKKTLIKLIISFNSFKFIVEVATLI